jgi:hypothetical protein
VHNPNFRKGTHSKHPIFPLHVFVIVFLYVCFVPSVPLSAKWPVSSASPTTMLRTVIISPYKFYMLRSFHPCACDRRDIWQTIQLMKLMWLCVLSVILPLLSYVQILPIAFSCQISSVRVRSSIWVEFHTEAKQRVTLWMASTYRWVYRSLRLPEFPDNLHMKVVTLLTLHTGRLYPSPKEISPVVISVRGWVDLRATEQPAGLCQ